MCALYYELDRNLPSFKTKSLIISYSSPSIARINFPREKSTIINNKINLKNISDNHLNDLLHRLLDTSKMLRVSVTLSEHFLNLFLFLPFFAFLLSHILVLDLQDVFHTWIILDSRWREGEVLFDNKQFVICKFLWCSLIYLESTLNCKH